MRADVLASGALVCVCVCVGRGVVAYAEQGEALPSPKGSTRRAVPGACR